MTEERVKRKLSAILSADAAGYSRLMGEDEVSTVRTLEAYRKVMADLIEQFRGRVVDSPGDNLLAEFSSVVDAVQCAVEIHEVIRAKNEELPEDRRMLFRIGINLGDVIEEGDHIYGDGVNIAARLEGLAEPGGVCISGSAHEQIKNKLALGYEYIGEHRVKNITEPLKVYKVPVGPKAVTPREERDKKTKLKNWQWTALGAAGAIIVIIGALAIWNFYSRGPSIEPKQTTVVPEVKVAPKTIAVLPFVNLSSDPEQEYFVDGLSEEIINCLTQIPNLGVTGRTSSFTFKGSNKKTQEIANELDVDHILEGSVRKAGNSLRITAQLIRAADDLHLWSKTYDRELKDIFAIQEDIATAVADELKMTLGVGKSVKLVGGTDKPEAYEIYLMAKAKEWEFVQSDLLSGMSQLLELIDEAIALDPEFSSAWAFKGRYHQVRSMFLPIDQVASELDAAIDAALKAINFEPNLAEGYAVLGAVRTRKNDFISAESAYRRALELSNDPNLTGSVEYYFTIGNFKKVKEICETALANDPLHPWWRGFHVYILGFFGDMQRAKEEYHHGGALLGDGWRIGDDRITEMRLISGDVLSRDEILISSPIWDAAKEHLNSPKNGIEELRRVYNDGKELSGNDLMYISMWAAYFGDSEFALEALERGAGTNNLYFFQSWSLVMHEVRQLPRFKKLVRDIGLVDYWNKFGWPDICRPLDNGDFECD